MLNLAAQLAIFASGLFLVVGIATGGWKYHHIRTSADHKAPAYVNIAHQASLAYAFSSLVVAALAQFSLWPQWLNVFAVVIMLYQFAFAIISYVIHGFDRTMRNQFAPPHRMHNRPVPAGLVRFSMVVLFICELGGALILLSGFALAQLG